MEHDEQVMSPNQARLLRALAVEAMGEQAGAAHLEELREQYPRPTREQASAWITELKERKSASGITSPPKGRGGLPSVAAGRYAVSGSDGSTYLYKVDRPEQGRFAGYTFVSWVRESGYESPLRGGRMERVLEQIARDPMGALVAYGHRTGTCGVCGRRLSDPESVEAGIGPVCASKV